MARPRAAESIRSRSKTALIEETTRGIEQLQDILASIEDFSREGFPYRDAARAKAELQLRESVRRIFGERSQEFQTYRHYKLRISTKAETGQSIAAIKQLIQTLEDRKLELQGLQPPVLAPPLSTPPQMALVPPATTAQITLPTTPTPAAPVTLSVAMTTNLGVPPAPVAPVPLTPSPEPSSPPSPAPPLTVPPISPTATGPSAPPPTPPMRPTHQTNSSVSAPVPPTPIASPGNKGPRTASPDVPHSETPTTARMSPSPELAALMETSSSPASPQAHQLSEPESPGSAPAEAPFRNPLDLRDPLESVRKICQRFHAVARQLRLRKDYRATLEVEDDYDLQDLLCALLRVEFDEIGIEEWIPPYAGGAPRSVFLLHGGRIAVVVKKTRPGLTTKELAEQISTDSSHHESREKCAALFCFIYDPEGRIGSPKQLETDLTSVSDRYMLDVLVAPK